MTLPKPPKTYFAPTYGGVRIYTKACSFNLSDGQVAAFVDWLADGRPDLSVERRQAWEAFQAERIALREAAAE